MGDLPIKGEGAPCVICKYQGCMYDEMCRRAEDEAQKRCTPIIAENEILVAEIKRLRAWIDTEARECPSNSIVDAILGGPRSSAFRKEHGNA